MTRLGVAAGLEHRLGEEDALGVLAGPIVAQTGWSRTLVYFGFRLPSALDNRPLNFAEFENHINQVVYVSATPGPYEYEHSQQIAELLIRPTGLVDPSIEVRPTKAP